MYRQLLVPTILICVISLTSCSTLNPKKSEPAYLSKVNLSQNLMFKKRIWNGRGIVIIGRIGLPPKSKIASRVRIYPDGSYSTALYPGRTLVFYAHTYTPLAVTKFHKNQTDIYDAGTVNFVKAAKTDLRKLKLRVDLDEPKTHKNAITCKLMIRNHKSLWADHGYNCGATVNVQVASKTVTLGEKISFSQLSRIPYSLVITSPGYIKQELKIPQMQSGVIDLGKVCLKKATKFKIFYQARVRQKDKNWIGDKKIRAAVISCNGNSEFLFSNQRDGLGNSLELRMTPVDNDVKASFFYYQNDSFYNLGKRSIDSITNWKDIKKLLSNGAPEVLLKDSQLYFFRINDINGTEIELLFQVKRI